MAVVYFSIGSNSDDAVGSVLEAIENLMSEGGVKPLGMGAFYETEPQGVADQPWFVNTAVALEVGFTPEETLRRIKNIERKMGRVPTEQRWGPREIDIDIVFYNDLVMDTPELVIPHPEAANRRFVLQPLADINPSLKHPVLGKTVSELLSALPEEGQAMRKLDP